MPTNNKGKEFEKRWKESCQRQDVFCLRLNDSDLSWNPSIKNKTGFTPKNKADFICFQKGNLFPLELKSTCYNSISIQREEKEATKMIKLHQIKSLVEFNHFNGVFPGFLLNFREEDDNHNIVDEITYWLSIDNFSNFYCDSTKSSINKLDVINYNGIIVESKKLRKNFTYNPKGLFDKILEQDWVTE